MAQQRITFEWILEEQPNAPWHGLDTDQATRAAWAGERILTQRVLRSMTLLLVAVALATGAGLTPAEQARREAQDGIQFALDLENNAWERRDRILYESLFDPNIGEDWVSEWRDHWRSGSEEESVHQVSLLFVNEAAGIMQATVQIHQTGLEWWQSSPYREERFYRRVDHRWVRTVPPAEYWGARQELTTDHLRFVFYARDAAAVRAAAPKLQRAYVNMYHTLGTAAPPDQQQNIVIVPRPVSRWSSSASTLEVTSPLLAAIPEGQSAGDFLAYETMNWFTYRAVRESAPNMTVRYLYRWPIIVWGLRGWLREDLLGQDNPWRSDVTAILQDAAADYLPLTLEHISELRGNPRPTRELVVLRYLTAESFIRYVVDTYGRERLPDLLTALVRHGKWEEIIPPLYDKSVDEFVAEWNAYVVTHYGLYGLE